MVQVIVTILLYSSILTVVTMYKDSSSYFIVEPIDVIVAGPIAWAIVILVKILQPIFPVRQQSKWVDKDEKYITRIVKKVIREYKKKKNIDYYINLKTRIGDCMTGDYEGWNSLLRKRALNEGLNYKFNCLMRYQTNETINEIKKYCKILSEDELREDDCNEFY